MTSTHASNRPQAGCPALTIFAVRRQTRIVAPSCRATWTKGHSVQSAHVGIAHTAAISHGEHKPHAHFARPAFKSHAFGLALNDIQRRPIRKFQRAEMAGLNLPNAGEHVEQPREVRVAVGMQGEGLHAATIRGSRSIARDI